MLPRVYVETTVVSYLVAKASRDVVIAGHQQVTREWWESCAARFEPVASELVIQEAQAGDTQAAQERLQVLRGVKLLEITPAALELARQLLAATALPRKAAEDALHVALAATNGIEYLATWNCRHLANATIRERIEAVCRAAGCRPPIICTPEELLESGSDD